MRYIVFFLCFSLVSCVNVSVQQNYANNPTGKGVIVNVDARQNGYDHPVRIWLEKGIYQIERITPAEGGQFMARHAWAGENAGCDRLGVDCLQGWQWSIVAMSDSPMKPLNRKFHNGQPIFWVPGTETLKLPPPSSFTPRATAELANTLAPQEERFELDASGFVLFFDNDRQTYDNLGGISFRVVPVSLNGPDTDGDLYSDQEDAFPGDATARLDSDGDGYPDRWNLGQEAEATMLTIDAFLYDAERHLLPSLIVD